MYIDKKVLYVAEVASLLGCCSQVIYQLIDSGKLAAYKEPGKSAGVLQKKLLMNTFKSVKKTIAINNDVVKLFLITITHLKFIYAFFITKIITKEYNQHGF